MTPPLTASTASLLPQFGAYWGSPALQGMLYNRINNPSLDLKYGLFGGGWFSWPGQPCCLVEASTGFRSFAAKKMMFLFYLWPKGFVERFISAYDDLGHDGGDYRAFALKVIMAIQPGTNLREIARNLPMKCEADDILAALGVKPWQPPVEVLLEVPSEHVPLQPAAPGKIKQPANSLQTV